MFTYPAKELFNAEGTRRVVWSEEEYSAALAEGWSEEKPGPVPPTLEQVLASGYEGEAAEQIVANEQRKAAAGIKPYGPNEEKPAKPAKAPKA